METVSRKALTVFTEYVSGYGMVVGNPDDDAVKVPVHLVDRLVDEGKIAGEAASAKPAKAPEATALPDGYAMHHKGFGKYEVSGPGIESGTVAANKADAEAMIAEASAAKTEDAPPA